MSVPLRWGLLVLATAVAALATGLVASSAADGPFWSAAIAFALVVAPVVAGLAWLVLFPVARTRHPEDTVESAWMDRASSGAFHDLAVVLGVAVVFDAGLDVIDVPIIAVLALAMVDVSLRYLVLWRWEG